LCCWVQMVVSSHQLLLCPLCLQPKKPNPSRITQPPMCCSDMFLPLQLLLPPSSFFSFSFPFASAFFLTKI
jgi:hypothetical protein